MRKICVTVLTHDRSSLPYFESSSSSNTRPLAVKHYQLIFDAPVARIESLRKRHDSITRNSMNYDLELYPLDRLQRGMHLPAAGRDAALGGIA